MQFNYNIISLETKINNVRMVEYINNKKKFVFVKQDGKEICVKLQIIRVNMEDNLCLTLKPVIVSLDSKEIYVRLL